MKTILVDAWNTFVTEEGINAALQELLDTYENTKIIVTNATIDEQTNYGIVDMPYEVYSLSHKPNKTDPIYFETLCAAKGLQYDDVLYVEHNPEAVKAAQGIGITAYLYDWKEKDVAGVKEFLLSSIDHEIDDEGVRETLIDFKKEGVSNEEFVSYLEKLNAE